MQLELTLNASQRELWNKFCDKHVKCTRDPVTGFSKFGTIGGGMSYSLHVVKGHVKEMYATCYACNATEQLKYDTNAVKESRCTLSDTELARICKIAEQFDDFIVEIRPTGLGPIVHIKFNIDITDTDAW